jgi:hypothetical protein
MEKESIDQVLNLNLRKQEEKPELPVNLRLILENIQSKFG